METLLNPVRQNKTRGERVPFVSTFGPQSGKISKILRKHWPMITQGCSNIKAFNHPPLMSYKKDRSLRDSLVKSDVGTQRVESIQRTLAPVKLGNFPCLHSACCNNMTKGDSFSHAYSGKKFFGGLLVLQVTLFT